MNDTQITNLVIAWLGAAIYIVDLVLVLMACITMFWFHGRKGNSSASTAGNDFRIATNNNNNSHDGNNDSNTNAITTQNSLYRSGSSSAALLLSKFKPKMKLRHRKDTAKTTVVSHYKSFGKIYIIFTALATSLVILIRVIRMVFVAHGIGELFPYRWISWLTDLMVYCCLLTYIARSWKLIFWLGWNQQQLTHWNMVFRRKMARYRERIEKSHRELKRKGEEFKSAVLAELTPRSLYTFQTNGLSTPRSLMFTSTQSVSESYEDDDAKFMRVIQQKRKSKVERIAASDRGRHAQKHARSRSQTHAKSRSDATPSIFEAAKHEESGDKKENASLQQSSNAQDQEQGKSTMDSNRSRRMARSKSLSIISSHRVANEPTNITTSKNKNSNNIPDEITPLHDNSDDTKDCEANKIISAFKDALTPTSTSPDEEEKTFKSQKETNDNGDDMQERETDEEAGVELENMSQSSESDIADDESEIDIEIGDANASTNLPSMELNLSAMNDTDSELTNKDSQKAMISKKTSFYDYAMSDTSETSGSNQNLTAAAATQSSTNVQIEKIMAINAQPIFSSNKGGTRMSSKPKRFSSISRRSHIMFVLCSVPAAIVLLILAIAFPLAIPSVIDLSKANYEHLVPNEAMLYIQTGVIWFICVVMSLHLVFLWFRKIRDWMMYEMAAVIVFSVLIPLVVIASAIAIPADSSPVQHYIINAAYIAWMFILQLTNIFIPIIRAILLDYTEKRAKLREKRRVQQQFKRGRESITKKSSVMTKKLSRYELESIYTFDRVMNEPQLRELFKKLMLRLLCVENWFFLEEVELYRKLASATGTGKISKRKELAADIIARYITSGSVMELNISTYEKLAVLEKFQRLADTCPPSLFKEVEATIRFLIRQDIYPKLFESNLFREWLKKNYNKR